MPFQLVELIRDMGITPRCSVAKTCLTTSWASTTLSGRMSRSRSHACASYSDQWPIRCNSPGHAALPANPNIGPFTKDDGEVVVDENGRRLRRSKTAAKRSNSPRRSIYLCATRSVADMVDVGRSFEEPFACGWGSRGFLLTAVAPAHDRGLDQCPIGMQTGQGQIRTEPESVNRRGTLTLVLPQEGMLPERLGTFCCVQAQCWLVKGRKEGAPPSRPFTVHDRSRARDGGVGRTRRAVCLRSFRKRRCTIECCISPNVAGSIAASRRVIDNAVVCGSAASQLSIVARFGSSLDSMSMRVLYLPFWRRCAARTLPVLATLPRDCAKASQSTGCLACAAASLRLPIRVPSSSCAARISASNATGSRPRYVSRSRRFDRLRQPRMHQCALVRRRRRMRALDHLGALAPLLLELERRLEEVYVPTRRRVQAPATHAPRACNASLSSHTARRECGPFPSPRRSVAPPPPPIPRPCAHTDVPCHARQRSD